ncbi:MAG: beta-L-arabinofuranosidase domain-containing protein [Bacteroidales bacterium]
MKRTLIAILLLTVMNVNAEKPSEKFNSLPFGSIKPSGWLKEQMQKDIAGFVGNLDKLVPELMNDPIYGVSRLQKQSKAKDLGNLKAGDADGDEQYKWWNSETQSNWWDGYLRNIFLLDDKQGIEKAAKYVKTILATQDEDGYIGIYDKELRYKFNTENGELWSKATLYRGLLAYYEFTKDETVFKAVARAVDNVMRNYPINASSPFSSGTSFNGGVSHGLTFTDVLERMYFLTKDEKYRQYALFLYRDFSNSYQSEADAQLKNILNPAYQLKSHGVHTFEHIRALIIAKYAGNNEEIDNALKIYLDRIKAEITMSGGAIGDEWIAERKANATHTGYEYCSLQELLDSYCLLFQKTGNANKGDVVENIFYNAAQGARNPQHSCIAYLKTDNSFEMLGTKNGEVEPDRKQTRYKYSPAHQDVAVCCNPNAGRISPYFVQNSWMRENETTLVATLLMPNILETILNGNKIQIENVTQYPAENDFKFKIVQANSSKFTLKIRKPDWVKKVKTNEKYTIENGFMVIERGFKSHDAVEISFETDIQVKTDNAGSHYFTYGALLYALPIKAKEIVGRSYSNEFSDYTYQPLSLTKYAYSKGKKTTYSKGRIETELVNQRTSKLEKVTLLPIGKTILRQTTF